MQQKRCDRGDAAEKMRPRRCGRGGEREEEGQEGQASVNQKTTLRGSRFVLYFQVLNATMEGEIKVCFMDLNDLEY